MAMNAMNAAMKTSAPTPSRTSVRHFIDLKDMDAAELRRIVDVAASTKARFKRGEVYQPLKGKVMAMIFEKPSTRTRISFEVGMMDLGMHVIPLTARDMQLGRGETVADTARVLSRYVDSIMIRTDDHQKLIDLADAGTIPVINGLTDYNHPCQILADILTFEEHRGPIKGRTLAWVGDGNNVANSFISAAPKFGFKLRIATPDTLPPDARLLAWAKEQGADVWHGTDPEEAVKGADAVITDTWVSMGDNDADARTEALQDYQVNAALMAKAAPDAIFMHCLPAHREEEVTTEVIDGPQSVVWDEAENRLHAQKGIVLWCFGVI
jgi:ornithine carbamoyltransferase